MGQLAIAAMVVGAATAAYGAYKQGQSTSAAAKYNAQVAANNAVTATGNVERAGQAGEQQVAMSEQKTRNTVGAIKVAQAANGIDVNSGSAADVRTSQIQTGALDAMTIRANAAREAFGYQTQSANFTAQSQLDRSSATSASQAGMIGASSSLLGGLGRAGNAYASYQQQNGLTTHDIGSADVLDDNYFSAYGE